MVRTNTILAILAVILAIPTAWTLYRDRSLFVEYEQIPRMFAGFTRANVIGVVISRPRRDGEGALVRNDKGEVVRDALQLLRVDDDWQIAGQHPLAGVAVRGARVYERVLQHMESIRLDADTLVRQGADDADLARYGLADAEALLVQCYDASGPVAELFVGKDASGGQVGENVVRGFFVRGKDSNDVVLYEQSYWVLDVDAAQWYDHNPLRFDDGEVVEVTVHNPKGHVTVARDHAQAAEWRMVAASEDVGAVRNGEVRSLAQSLAMIDVQDFVERLPAGAKERENRLAELELAQPKLWAEVALADGTRHRVAVGKAVPGRNERYLYVSSIDFVMTVGEWIMARFEKNPAEALFDPPR